MVASSASNDVSEKLMTGPGCTKVPNPAVGDSPTHTSSSEGSRGTIISDCMASLGEDGTLGRAVNCWGDDSKPRRDRNRLGGSGDTNARGGKGSCECLVRHAGVKMSRPKNKTPTERG